MRPPPYFGQCYATATTSFLLQIGPLSLKSVFTCLKISFTGRVDYCKSLLIGITKSYLNKVETAHYIQAVLSRIGRDTDAARNYKYNGYC